MSDTSNDAATSVPVDAAAPDDTVPDDTVPADTVRDGVLRGSVIKVGDDVSCLDGIVSYEADAMWFAGRTAEAAQSLFSPLGQDVAARGKGFDFVVAGRNLGHGHGHYYWSSMALMKEAKVKAIFAVSFPFGFTRMAINAGLPAVEWRLNEAVEDGDEIEVNLAAGTVLNLTTGVTTNYRPLAPIVGDIVAAGGINAYAVNRLKAS